MRLVRGVVTEMIESGEGIERLAVDLDDGSSGLAVAYPRLSGRCRCGDRVLLNATAVELALGTGGVHFVVSNESATGPIVIDEPGGGHIMKLRYTPLQLDVLAVESPESPHHQTMREARSVEGMPVVCCGLHSQVPLVAAAVKAASTDASVAYCMTDHAALPAPLSTVVSASRSAGLIDTVITCGQAFGGDLEAVNLHSGLLAARRVAGADVAIVAIGPGVVGTATPFGHGGVHQGESINAVAGVGGRAVAALRVSFADKRVRHRGVSHHSLAALSHVALAPAEVALPALPPEYSDAIDDVLEEWGVWRLHRRAQAQAGRVPPPSLRGVEVTTMGRSFEEDPAFFAAAFAAGEIAWNLAGSVLPHTE